MGRIRKIICLVRCAGNLAANRLVFAGLNLQDRSSAWQPWSYTGPNAGAATPCSKELLPSGGPTEYYTKQGLYIQPSCRLRGNVLLGTQPYIFKAQQSV